MHPSARLSAAIELLDTISVERKCPADFVINNFFRCRRYIGANDRRDITDRVWRILRSWYRLCWWFRGGEKSVDGRLLVGADMLLNNIGSIKDVAVLFSAIRFAPKALTDAEKNLLQNIEPHHSLDHPDMPLAVRLECPEWIYSLLREQRYSSFESELEALLHPARLHLRVNTLKANRDDVMAALNEEGIETEPTFLSPWGLRGIGRQNIVVSQAFKQGLIEIQDEGSQLIIMAVAASPGMRVVDFCAGAGGKTLGLAMVMQNRGRIVACDISRARLNASKHRLRRAGVCNAESHLLIDGDKWLKRQQKSFDRVLVDVPCSGTGTWRRNPDMRRKLTYCDLQELVVRQAQILRRAADLVKEGGRLVYATCSLLAEENQQQISKFLAEHTDFHPIKADSISLPLPLTNEGSFFLSSAKHGTDGFFCSVMVRKG